MVGLKEFGDAAWACEQLYNTWLAGQTAATPALLDFSHKALNHLADWIEAIANQSAQAWKSGPLVKAAEAFGRGEPVGDIAAPSAEAAGLPAEEAVLSSLESPETLELDALPAAESVELIELDLGDDVFGDAAPAADAVPAAEQRTVIDCLLYTSPSPRDS